MTIRRDDPTTGPSREAYGITFPAVMLLLLALLGLAAPARAELPAGKRVALVVGNGGYRSVDRLANATNDARLIATTLRGLGFTLVGDGALLDLDREHLAQAVQEFGRALQGAEVGLFYYSGHGLQVQGVNWLVPVDANPTRPQDLDFQMVDADLVLRQMGGAGTKLNLVILDACRNNPFAQRGLRSLSTGLAEMRAPEGTLISYATQPGSVAADGAGANSPYTTALANEMRRPGVDIFRMFNQVGLQVKRDTGGAQQPWVSNSPIDGDFYFAGSTPPTPTPAPTPPPGPQVAAIVRPPDPAPLPPPSLPEPTDAASRLIAIARAQRCAILDTRMVGTTVELTGLAPAGQEWNGLLQQFRATRGIRTGTPEVEFVPPFACDAVDALAPTVRRSREAGGRVLTLNQREMTAGDTLLATLRGAAGQAVALDLFRPDGTVQHMQPALSTVRDGEVRATVTLSPRSVPGPRLVVAFISPAPLALGVRPHTERASVYLAALRRVLDATPGVQADIAPYELRAAAPAPAAVAARPAAAPSRCSALLQRAQLGETLSDADRAALRAECR